MSKTDKTRPVWVQASDPHNRGWLDEWHDHSEGVSKCDLHIAHPRDMCVRRLNTRRPRCNYWVSRIARNKPFRRTRSVNFYVDEFTTRDRAEWRQIARTLRYGSLNDAYDVEYAPRQHRHSAHWDAN